MNKCSCHLQEVFQKNCSDMKKTTKLNITYKCMYIYVLFSDITNKKKTTNTT